MEDSSTCQDLSSTDDEVEGGMKSAYSMSDMLDELDAEEEDHANLSHLKGAAKQNGDPANDREKDTATSGHEDTGETVTGASANRMNNNLQTEPIQDTDDIFAGSGEGNGTNNGLNLCLNINNSGDFVEENGNLVNNLNLSEEDIYSLGNIDETDMNSGVNVCSPVENMPTRPIGLVNDLNKMHDPNANDDEPYSGFVYNIDYGQASCDSPTKNNADAEESVETRADCKRVHDTAEEEEEEVLYPDNQRLKKYDANVEEDVYYNVVSSQQCEMETVQTNCGDVQHQEHEQQYEVMTAPNIAPSELEEEVPVTTNNEGPPFRSAVDGVIEGQKPQVYVKVYPENLENNSDPPLLRSVRKTESMRRGRIASDHHYETLEAAPLSPPINDEDDYSWGSSEFDSTFDEDDIPKHLESEKVVDPKTSTYKVERKVASPRRKSLSEIQVFPGMLDKLARRLSTNPKKDEEFEEETIVKVNLDLKKHPQPELPPTPSEITPEQVKRRHIVASIVDNEKCYTASLRRIVEDYENPLMDAKPQIISKSVVRSIFSSVGNILQCHNMFHIELAESIRTWDQEEKIGNVFTASFSKSIVFDVYSEFVNNFSFAMETAKKQARQKQAFADFLKYRLDNAPDKLSLFGLMVKPVQRFPQFIMLLQDLLKYTPKDHPDRLALQMALTELETLTHKLNETRRESENRYDVKKLITQITGRHSIKATPERYLVRQEDMLQMDYSGEETRSKPRRLILLNDQLICSTVISKEYDGSGKYKYKWSIPIKDVEIVEDAVSPSYHVQSGPGKTTIVSPKLDQSNANPWKKDLDDMLHDLAVVEQISQLVGQLRMHYESISQGAFLGLTRNLQLAIQKRSNVDCSILQLSIPTKNNTRMVYVFQLDSLTAKYEWLMEIKNAKLAIDKRNKPAWSVPESEEYFTFQLPLFIKPLLVDITKLDTKMKCAVPVVLPNPEMPGTGMQHLWVCSCDDRMGQVSLVSLHTSQPFVVESFQACNSAILCAEMVPGYITYKHMHAFHEDTVWMSTENNRMIIQYVSEETRQDPALVFTTPCTVQCLKYQEGRLFAGLVDGTLAVYVRDIDGVWNITEPVIVELGPHPVTCLLPVNYEMWTANGCHIFNISVIINYHGEDVDYDVQKTSHKVAAEDEVIECMVKAGAGLMVSFHQCAIIRIYCLESLKHIQDVNVASAVHKVLEGKVLTTEERQLCKTISITCLLASKGLLWVGTNVGFVLTLPLPRLEGIPQVKGRPCVSYHAHSGPVRYLVPISCSSVQLVKVRSTNSNTYTLESRSRETRNNDLDSLSDSGSLSEQGAASRYDTLRDTDAHPFVQSDSAALTLRRRFLLSEGRYASDDLGTLRSNKWTSTPDLRALEGSEESISSLYGNLLRGTEYDEFESELGESRRKRSQSAPQQPAFPPSPTEVRPKTNLQRRSSASKYATLPVLVEDNPISLKTSQLRQNLHNGHADEVTNGEREASPGAPIPHSGSTATALPSASPLLQPPTGKAPGATASKAVIVVSGGNGHVNWSESGPSALKYEDVCLMLWQCRV